MSEIKLLNQTGIEQFIKSPLKFFRAIGNSDLSVAIDFYETDLILTNLSNDQKLLYPTNLQYQMPEIDYVSVSEFVRNPDRFCRLARKRSVIINKDGAPAFILDTFKDKLILTAKAINNFKRSLNCRVGDIESIKFRGT